MIINISRSALKWTYLINHTQGSAQSDENDPIRYRILFQRHCPENSACIHFLCFRRILHKWSSPTHTVICIARARKIKSELTFLHRIKTHSASSTRVRAKSCSTVNTALLIWHKSRSDLVAHYVALDVLRVSEEAENNPNGNQRHTGTGGKVPM
jgi:hypothetical protein